MRAIDPRAAAVPGRPACRNCGAPMTAEERRRSDVCLRPDCRRSGHAGAVAAAAAALERRRERERAAEEARAIPALEAAAARIGEIAAGCVTAVVPFLANPVTPLPAVRRAAFEAHLDRIVAEGFAGETPAEAGFPEESFAHRPEIEADDPFALTACCIACRGNCCTLGNSNMAFLTAHMVALYRYRHPEATPEEVREAYLSRLPELSVREGCVFQGERGCTLPRAMRADNCHLYRCRGQEAMVPRVEARPDAPAAIVACAFRNLDGDGDEQVHRALTLTAAGEIAIHDDIPLGPAAEEA